MADGQKTEQPTQRRLERARKEGQFLSSRQFVSAVQFCAFVAVLGKWSGGWVTQFSQATRLVLSRAFGPELRDGELVRLARDLAWSCALPLVLCGAMLVAVSFAAQLVVSGMGVSWKKLAPDFKRLNPLPRLRELPRQNLPSLLQAMVLMMLSGAAVYTMARDHAADYLSLPRRALPAAMTQIAGSLQDLLWRAAGVFVLFGAIDLFRERRRHQNTLRMTKQEVREELKETEGNPLMKARIRRLQRDQARKRMMQAVPKATAVVVNPTHYAVALRYEPETMRAPRVVAKGRNYLARRIKERAIEHLVPIVENPPLAQALYKSVDVGQEIPPELYRAVAEILAYIFKVLRICGAAGRT